MKKSRLNWYVTGNKLFPPAFHISKEFCLTFPLWWQNFPFDIISTKRVFILLPETWWQWLGRNRGENLLTGYFTKFLTPWMWILAVCVCVWTLSHISLFAAPWNVGWQVPLFMKFSRIPDWVSVLTQGSFLTQGSNLHLSCLLHWQADYYH